MSGENGGMTYPAGFRSRDLIAAAAVVVIWGLNFVAMKVALREFTPFQLGTLRYVFAVLPLLFFVKPPALRLHWVLASGLAQLGQFAFLFMALSRGMTAALASVLMQTQVFFTTLLGVLLLHERLSGTMRAGLLFAALGLACFGANFLGGGGATGAVTLAGLVLNLIAAAMWAVANVVARRAQIAQPEYDALELVVWMSLVPILPFAALSWAFDPAATHWSWVQASAQAWAAVAYLGWFATVVAYALWTWLLKRHATSKVAPFSLAVPLVGLVAGIALLGEHVSAWQWAGSACVLSACVASMLGPRIAQWRLGSRSPA